MNTGTVWQHFDAAPYSPVSLYAATKQAFADVFVFYAEVQGLAVHTLELMDTYGPDDPRASCSPSSCAPRDGHAVELTDGTQLIDLVHVDDAARALLATARQAGATYGASGGETITLRELVERFRRPPGSASTSDGAPGPPAPRDAPPVDDRRRHRAGRRRSASTTACGRCSARSALPADPLVGLAGTSATSL